MTTTSVPARGAVAWSAAAPNLATWAFDRLVNRIDAWGAYRAEKAIGQEYALPDGRKGKLGEQQTVKGRLSRSVLIRHFQARDRSAIIGLHTAGVDNQSRGGALDIDWHGPTSTAADVNLNAALSWFGALVRQGFHPLLTESNGQGGFHLRVLLAGEVPADRLFYFLKNLTNDHKRLGFDKPPEQFPKQPDVRRCRKGLGNWLRLPGRHHKRDFWSRVWDGERWLEGPRAIDFILSLTGDAPDLVPSIPLPAARTSRRQPVHGGQPSNLSKRIAAYMWRLPNLGEGQGRDDVAFNFAAFLVRDLALDDAIALDWLERWDAGNTPPKGRDRLVEIIRNAHAYGQRPVGCARDLDPTTEKSVVLAGGRPGHVILRCRVEI